MKIPVDDNTSMELLEDMHAESLFNLVNANRDHLRTWLPWVDQMRSVTNFRQHIVETKRRAAERSDYGLAIIINKNIAGRIGLYHINHQNKIAEIGYWLDEGMQGKGIITKCCTALINYAFTSTDMNRIEIKCGVGNERSLAIPEKLHFKQEGILRQAEWLNGKFIDLYLYAMLKKDWENNNG